MTATQLIARAELVHLRHSRLAVVLAVLLALVMLVASLNALWFAQSETALRSANQQAAEAAFEEQPDRHPHRMVHYGHYVYRSLPPLAAIDPGVDAFTGTSIFLEGHRQNTATFSEVRESADLTRFGTLSPAFCLQILLPLVVILFGYATVSGERRSGTLLQLLAQSVPAKTLLLGKLRALLLPVAIAYLPLAAALVYAGIQGEALTAVTMALAYVLYAVFWCVVTVSVSAIASSDKQALMSLLSLWLLIAILLPRLASEAALVVYPSPTQAETAMATEEALLALGDSHNASDPNFARFRQEILDQYGVATVEELPVNFRGLVAMEGEARQAEVLNEFAEERMTREAVQSALTRGVAVLSPVLALRQGSSNLAGTGLEDHHRFLREAEAHRFAFVQALNTLHAHELTYADDTNRSGDRDAERRTRISAEHWAELPKFAFTASSEMERFSRAMLPLAILVVWLGVAVMLFQHAVRRLV